MKLVIIGGGHVAAQLVMSANIKKLDAEITLISDEAHLPYQRPPLSKAYLLGDLPLERMPITPARSYEKAGVNLRLNTRVQSIDPTSKTVTTNDGDVITYDKLVLATGGRVRKLPVPGAGAVGVHYVRTLDDIDAMKPSLKGGSNLVVVGGGYIGLEAASVARKLGVNVTLLEAQDRLLQRVVAPEVSAFYTEIHREEGVTVKLGASVTEIEAADGKATAVSCADGSSYPADTIIVGIGITANSELAAESGLTCSNGIEINEFCQTSDPDIYAAGDVALFHSHLYGQKIRLESVPNASDQAKVIIDHLNGTATVYEALPWFWSDQYDLKLQICGLSLDYDRIVIRREDARKIGFFYMKDDCVVACDAVNQARSFMGAKKLIAGKHPVKDRDLTDPTIDLKSLI